MSKTFALALRNLLRNRRRSLTTVLAMVVGLTAVLLFGGYRSNIVYGIETGFVRQSGHLQIQYRNYYLEGGDNPTAYGISHYEQIINAVRQDPVLMPMLNVVTPTLQLGGLAGNFAASVSGSVLATGLIPEQRIQMEQWNDYGVISYANSLQLLDSSPDAAVIGEGVARKLKLCKALQIKDCKKTETPVDSEGREAPDDIIALSNLEQAEPHQGQGSQIEMLAATAHGAPNVASLTVIAATNMGIKTLDDIYLAMHLGQAQKLIYGASDPKVTAIQIQLLHTAQIPIARARLEMIVGSKFKGRQLDVLDFATLNPMYGQTVQFMNSIFGFIAILIAVIVLFTIGNTMSTSVLERTVEIGTLRALGLRRSGLRYLFLCEGILLGLMGAAFGLVSALTLAYFINYSGLTWVPPGYAHAYLIRLLLWQDPSLLTGSVLGLFLVTIVSAWWPANRASKLMIVDALHHV